MLLEPDRETGDLSNSFFRSQVEFLKLKLSTAWFKRPFPVTDDLGFVTDNLEPYVNRR